MLYNNRRETICIYLTISSSLVVGVNTGYISDKSQGNDTTDITDTAPSSPVQSPPPSTSSDPSYSPYII